MKRLLILSACALCLAAVLSAQTPVNVTGPINTPEGLPWTGTLQISNPPVICGSIKVAKSTIHVTVTAGVFDRTLNLYPIADCGSGGYGYTVQSIGTDGNRPASYWVIHASAAPVTVAQIEQSTPPSPSATVPLSILQLSTGNDGDCLTKLGGGAITNPCAGGLGYYLVSQSANAPQNAIDLALLSSGLLKIIVSGGVASISTAAAGTDYQAPISGAPEAWPTFAAVATSGSYADLSNRPTIPSTTAQITESGNLYFTPARVVAAMAGLYQAPITGAPGSWPATWPWASLSGVPASFTPSAHASTHAAAGSDPLSLSASQIGSGYPYASLSGAPSIPSASSATPAMDGTGAAGSSANYARADHIHPTDTSRQAAIAPGTQAQYLRGDFSLATFPTTWPWGSLSSVPSTFTPSAHASTHAAAGSDPISVSASQVGNGYPYSSLASPPTIPSTASQVGAIADWGANGIPYRTALGTARAATISDLTALGSWPWASLSGAPTTWAWNNLTGIPSLVNSLNSQSGAITLGIGTSGASPNWSASTLNIPMASAASVTAGLLSNSDYTSRWMATFTWPANGSIVKMVSGAPAPAALADLTGLGAAAAASPAFTGTISDAGTSATDSAGIGSEATNSTGWTTAGWTGSYDSFSHTAGAILTGPTYSSGASGCTNGTQAVTFTNGGGSGAAGTITVSGGVPTGAITMTAEGSGYASIPTAATIATCTGTAALTGGAYDTQALIYSVSGMAANTFWQTVMTISGRTAGSIAWTVGGSAASPVTTATATFSPMATGTGALTITPTQDFNGTVAVSVKQITAISAPAVNLKDSTGTTSVAVSQQLASNHNVFIGGGGTYNTTGAQNIGIGIGALADNTIGINNVAQGYNALTKNTTGTNNDAFGTNTLSSNTTGGYNVALGTNSLATNTTGGNNMAMGYDSMVYNTTGAQDTGIGYEALYNNSTGAYNSALGFASLFNLTTGGYNSALGALAGEYIADGATANQTSTDSTYVGYNTKAQANGDTYETVIGYTAIGAGSYTVVIGSGSVTDVWLGNGSATTVTNARLHTTAVVSGGTQNVSGCSLTSAAGGATAGKFASGTAGVCTVTITPGSTAPNGWSCWASDVTTTTDHLYQTAFNATTATIAGTTSSGDAIVWGCIGF